jgi:hypothetical protein
MVRTRPTVRLKSLELSSMRTPRGYLVDYPVQPYKSRCKLCCQCTMYDSPPDFILLQRALLGPGSQSRDLVLAVVILAACSIHYAIRTPSENRSPWRASNDPRGMCGLHKAHNLHLNPRESTRPSQPVNRGDESGLKAPRPID